MNKAQRIVLVATAAVILALALFPPFVLNRPMPEGRHLQTNAGFGWVFRPPIDNGLYDYFRPLVNIPALVSEQFAAIAIGALLWLALKSER